MTDKSIESEIKEVHKKLDDIEKKQVKSIWIETQSSWLLRPSGLHLQFMGSEQDPHKNHGKPLPRTDFKQAAKLVQSLSQAWN